MSEVCFFFFKQKTAYEISECDWSTDVSSSDPSGTIGIEGFTIAEITLDGMVILDHLPSSNGVYKIIYFRVAESGNGRLHFITRNIIFLRTANASAEIFELFAEIPRLESGKTRTSYNGITLTLAAVTSRTDFVAQWLIGCIDRRILLCIGVKAREPRDRSR